MPAIPPETASFCLDETHLPSGCILLHQAFQGSGLELRRRARPGSQGRDAWDESYPCPRSPRPSRPLCTPHQQGRGRWTCARHPRPPDLLRPAAPATALQSPPLYLARRSAAPRSPSRDPHTRPAAAGSIAPQAGRSHADLRGSGALAGSRRADRAALAARPPSIRAEARCSRLGRRLILRTRRRDAQTQSWPGSSAGLAVSLKAL